MDDTSAGIVAVDEGVVGALNAKRISWIDGLQLIRFGVRGWWDDVDELNYCDGSVRLKMKKNSKIALSVCKKLFSFRANLNIWTL